MKEEFVLNNIIYKQTIFQGYYITIDGDIAQIKFDEDNRLKSFFLMRQEITKDGYSRVEINHKHYLIHRLVYQTWSKDELRNDLVIDHLDANPQNNHINNLRQVSQWMNVQNGICHGNFGHNGNTKIEVLNNETGEQKIYNSIKDFYIDINAPQYIINNGGLGMLNKRKEYKSILGEKLMNINRLSKWQFIKLEQSRVHIICNGYMEVRGNFKVSDVKVDDIVSTIYQSGVVVSLHLPMILAKARRESKDFYEVLNYYLEMIRNLHKRTYDYIGELRASVNPVMFCEGGAYGGHLKPDEKIKSILPPMTISYGITALNELQELYNGKSIREDGEFALEVMKYIQDYINRIKEEDHILYAIYGTPAESLCGLQVEQFRKKYGIVENVSDRPYVSNSFHCHVTENMSPIEKQDKEERFWNFFNGGKIQYCRYNLGYNKEAIKTLVLRAMDKGFYEGVNLAMCYCEDCGYQQVEMDACPKCGSKLITKIDRMNGYLGFTRVHGETRYNPSKIAEINDRVSM